jgi:hypothetical protein
VSKPSDLVQGTLDMLILKILALQPLNGYRCSPRSDKITRKASLQREPARSVGIRFGAGSDDDDCSLSLSAACLARSPDRSRPRIAGLIFPYAIYR